MNIAIDTKKREVNRSSEEIIELLFYDKYQQLLESGGISKAIVWWIGDEPVVAEPYSLLKSGGRKYKGRLKTFNIL